ncbi:hypothetical protein H2203_008981 [Taxawa tesnikishii (nom. ined.)]|nr:hypothetical protein H2203_008981 [Dothideales sp. JES 119]
MAGRSDNLQKHFNINASIYDQQTGGCTRAMAKHILTLLPPITSTSVIHDNACGPGVATSEILSQYTFQHPSLPLPTIHATDFASAMVSLIPSLLQGNSSDHGKEWASHVQTAVMDGCDLSAFPDGTFTHSVTNFGLFAFPDAVKGVSEIYRVLKPGGVAVVTTWKRARNLEVAQQAQQAIRPDLPTFRPVGDEWLTDSHLLNVLRDGGFEREGIAISSKEVRGQFPSLEALIAVFEGPFWQPAKKGWRAEDLAKWEGDLKKAMTEEEKREASLGMTAWIAVARKGKMEA